MQGYVLRVLPARGEDVKVWLLTRERLVRAYRFYGARHSVVTQGYKLDFELESMGASSGVRLRNALHLGFSWLGERERLQAWQNFVGELGKHLRGIEELDPFYFELLDECARRFTRQNPERVVVEAYLRLLDFEGRLHEDLRCVFCGGTAEDKVCLTQGFSPAHPRCAPRFKFETSIIKRLFKTQSTAEMSDEIVQELYYIVLEGF